MSHEHVALTQVRIYQQNTPHSLRRRLPVPTRRVNASALQLPDRVSQDHAMGGWVVGAKRSLMGNWGAERSPQQKQCAYCACLAVQ